MLICKHNNLAEDCNELCENCDHECKYHNYSKLVPCWRENCMCEGFEDSRLDLRKFKRESDEYE